MIDTATQSQPIGFQMLSPARARDLLQTDRTITEIDMAVGYANRSKFAAAFRRLYDCATREWRNARR